MPRPGPAAVRLPVCLSARPHTPLAVQIVDVYAVRGVCAAG